LFAFPVTPAQTGFPHAAQAALVIRTSHHLKSLKVTHDVQFLITSRAHERLSPDQFNHAIRGHWTIEDILHYPRDVTLGEDQSTARTGYSPENLAAFRNLVQGLNALHASTRPARIKYVPHLVRVAQNDRDALIALVTRPLPLPAVA
jgi:predicted transposase YbfD/YdcC